VSWFAEISKGSDIVRIGGDGTVAGAALNARSLKGWWSTPSEKVSMTERESGDGAHDVEPEAVLYSARTVTLEVEAGGRNRLEVQESMEALLRMAHGIVALRVVDGLSDTYCSGFLSTEVRAAKATNGYEDVTVTVRCPNPERLSSVRRRGFLNPSREGFGGLVYDSGVLAFPLSYGAGAGSVRSVCTVENRGTSTAYPLISASGYMPQGFVLTDVATGDQLEYSQAVGVSPVVIDCRSRTASVLAVDVTRNVTRRSFPTVGPGGTLTLSLSASGTGTVEVSVRDTYV